MNNKVEDIVVEKIETAEKIEKLTCGIIMPIAGMGAEYSADHWIDVMKIIHSAVERAGFIPRIVSESEESTVIHGSIINNIYNDAIVVCDVSNKNANVMFELGMRLAFNKPVVIIKDDKTDYSFDTGNIQHENYRKDLRHNTVEKFINDLSKKIKKTYEASVKPEYQSFLSYFGKFEVAKIENKPIGEGEAIEKLLNKMSVLESKFTSLLQKEEESTTYVSSNRAVNSDTLVVYGPKLKPDQIRGFIDEILGIIGILASIETSIEENRFKVVIKFKHSLSLAERRNYKEIVEKLIDDHSLPF
ncbi:hypothetical protein QR674_12680 [Acinetobacter chinensis]|uniref:RNA helicase n=1 Tax=Acinetobacter chinensis TaxID=2004650 RepID=A0ABU3WHF8_9GAMM|nr:hypothetical protein [Acinetobacter chinensis]MDV2469836.1 hypothetical protein [Acinetobacter chinensis]